MQSKIFKEMSVFTKILFAFVFILIISAFIITPVILTNNYKIDSEAEGENVTVVWSGFSDLTNQYAVITLLPYNSGTNTYSRFNYFVTNTTSATSSITTTLNTTVKLNISVPMNCEITVNTNDSATVTTISNMITLTNTSCAFDITALNASSSVITITMTYHGSGWFGGTEYSS